MERTGNDYLQSPRHQALRRVSNDPRPSMSPLVASSKFDMMKSDTNLNQNARGVLKQNMRGPGFADRSAKIVSKYSYSGVMPKAITANRSGVTTKRIRDNGS